MPERAITIFKQVRNPNDFIINLLFNACAQLKTAEALDLIRSVVSKMPESLYKNVYVVTSLLDALLKCGDVDNARSIFDRTTTKTVTMYGAMMKGNVLTHALKAD